VAAFLRRGQATDRGRHRVIGSLARRERKANGHDQLRCRRPLAGAG
jgi:hypothetical protein